VRRIYGADDPGNAFRATDAQSARRGGIYKLDGVQWTFTDGSGSVYWFVDTTAGATTVQFPDARDIAPDVQFIVKRLTGGVNTLTISAVSGNLDGSATYSLPNQYDFARFVAYNGDFYTV
jgi:hypothetical protein